MIFEKIIKYLFVIFTVMNFTWTAHAYYDKTHSLIAKFAVELVKKIDAARKVSLYQEVYDPFYMIELGKGAWKEDHGAVAGNERSFRHYYDPDYEGEKKGVPFYSYYKFWPGGAKVSRPRGGCYTGALEWARTGTDDKKRWSTDNPFNWEGAIRAYDYTASSRSEAYYRLGHVVHLLGDMAEPDHATNTPHPGSGFLIPEDLDEMCKYPLQDLIYRKEKELYRRILQRLSVPILKLYLYYERKIIKEPDYIAIGFEGLIEDSVPPGLVKEFFDDENAKNTHLKESRFRWDKPLAIKGKRIIKLKKLDDYFNELAKKSKLAVQDRKKFPLPLGVEDLNKYVHVIMPLQYKSQPINIIPAIDMRGSFDKEKYSKLAWGLLQTATELNAGLLEHFHDIVNPPPYVKAVTVKQNNIKYHAYWDDVTYFKYIKEIPNRPHLNYGIVPHRLIKYDENSNFEPNKEAIIEVEFGPRCIYPEPIDRGSVEVTIDRLPITGTLVNDPIKTMWRGSFIVPSVEEEKQMQIEISAKDNHFHYDPKKRTFVKGFELDADPKSPAKVWFEPPNKYSWNLYEPGLDKYHKIKIKPEEEEKKQDKIFALDITVKKTPPISKEKEFLCDIYIIFRKKGSCVWITKVEENFSDPNNPKENHRSEWTLNNETQKYRMKLIYPNNPEKDETDELKSVWYQCCDEMGAPENRFWGWHESDYEIIPPGAYYRFYCSGKDDDGNIYEEEFYFDHKEWIPDGKIWGSDNIRYIRKSEKKK